MAARYSGVNSPEPGSLSVDRSKVAKPQLDAVSARCGSFAEYARRMVATLRDVAEAAGVHPGTVSRALNNPVEVSAKTVARVRKAPADSKPADRTCWAWWCRI